MFPKPEQIEVDCVHQADGWLSPGYLRIDADGYLLSVTDTPPPGWEKKESIKLEGWAIPGMPNLHSHAFQRVMAGRCEYVTSARATNSFWTWRELMYDFAKRMGPTELEAVAAQLYLEMLEAGMTSVAEFHYLHHQPGGHPYDERAELSLRILEAAKKSGIATTLLPVLYTRGGFDKNLEERQKRFAHASVDEFLHLLSDLRSRLETQKLHRLGIAVHSLRAVHPRELIDAISHWRSQDATAPIHIHIAEQEREVQDCVQALGARPVNWLLDNLPVDQNYCLVHATHMDPGERQRLAQNPAVVGLCPSTEANLGDGIFPIAEYLEEGGNFGIGSDSQVCVSVSEELRLLEYVQRLSRRQRNVCIDRTHELHRHVGRRLFDAALFGGSQALGLSCPTLVAGARADFVVLDTQDPSLLGHDEDSMLDAFVFSAKQRVVKDVMVGGRLVIQDRQHPAREEIRTDFERAVAKLARTT